MPECPNGHGLMHYKGGTPKTKQYDCPICGESETVFLGEVGDYGFREGN